MVVTPPLLKIPVSTDYAADVFVWDLDKTYLRTKFESFKDLVRAAREKAVDKVAFPGAAPLLRSLRRGPNGVKRPIYFVSASPPQIRAKIEEKFALDGVEVDGIYFKDNMRNLRPGRFGRLREQVGYKMLALLDLRAHLPSNSYETMFGDDAETDAAIYSMFSEIMEGRLANWPLYEFLVKQGVFRDEALKVAWRARHIFHKSAPRRVFITVHGRLDPRYFRRYGNRVTGTRTYFQTALALCAEKLIAIEDVAMVADELLGRGGMTRFELSQQLEDLRRQAVLTTTDARVFETRLAELKVVDI